MEIQNIWIISIGFIHNMIIILLLPPVIFNIMMRLLYVCIIKNSPKVEPFVNASECVV